jgi:hypothetical protein
MFRESTSPFTVCVQVLDAFVSSWRQFLQKPYLPHDISLLYNETSFEEQLPL